MKTAFAFVFAAIAATKFLVLAQEIQIQQSHLTCVPGLQSNNLIFAAKVRLKANYVQRQYSLRKCMVDYKKVDLCIPSTKMIYMNETTAEFPKEVLEGVQPQRIFNDFLCYNLKCRGQKMPPPRLQKAVDQFGVKKLRLTKNRYRLCVPAWKLGDNGFIIIGGTTEDM